MKRNFLSFLSISLLFVIFTFKNTSCTKEEFLPVIITSAVTKIDSTSICCGGVISSDGGSAVKSRGVCWSIGSTPKVRNNKTSDGAGIGSFSSCVTDLKPNTTYFIRAYATNSYGTAYGSALSFTTKEGVTPDLAIVSTLSILDITESTAKCSSIVVSEQGSQIISRGICWNTNNNPTVSDNKTINGAGIGGFTGELKGLSQNQKYYVRAYAVNSIGVAYGNVISFYTIGKLTDIEGNEYKTINIGNQIWMAENLKTTKLNNGTIISNSGWSYTAPAYCWYFNDKSNYGDVYGALYNWYTIESNNLCPLGWKIPSIEDWETLSKFYGGYSYSGGKLKEIGLNHWKSPNTGASNKDGFNGLPGGQREYGGQFKELGEFCYFWSSESENTNTAWVYYMMYNSNGFNSDNLFKYRGLSVRCIKE